MGVHFIADVVAVWDVFYIYIWSVKIKILGGHNFILDKAGGLQFGRCVGYLWDYELVHCLSICLSVYGVRLTETVHFEIYNLFCF